MRLSRRLIASLILGVTLVSVLFTVIDIRAQMEQLRTRLTLRAASEAQGLHEALLPLLRDHAIAQAAVVVERFRSRSQAAGVAIYDPRGQMSRRRPRYPAR